MTQFRHALSAVTISEHATPPAHNSRDNARKGGRTPAKGDAGSYLVYQVPIFFRVLFDRFYFLKRQHSHSSRELGLEYPLPERFQRQKKCTAWNRAGCCVTK
jgi:hypothetical protein